MHCDRPLVLASNSTSLAQFYVLCLQHRLKLYNFALLSFKLRPYKIFVLAGSLFSFLNRKGLVRWGDYYS